MNANSEQPTSRLRVGVVGCGLIGKRRAEYARAAGDEVVVVADVNTELATAVAAENNCEAVTDWREVVGREDVDVVVVATPNKFLVPVAVAALEQGKHVLTEKPPGRNAEETAQMVAAAEKAGRVVKVGFNHRYHPAIWKAHELSTAGAIGPLTYIRAVYGHGGRPGYDQEWRASADLSGGGELLDQGVHIIDLCRWFMGDYSEAYCAVATYYWNLGHFPSGHQLEDNAFAILRTADGQTAQLHTSWTQWRNRFSFEVFGRDGYLRIEGLGGSYGTETLVYGRRRPESGPPIEETFEFTGPDLSWEKEWQDFTSAIHAGGQPLSNGADGLQTMRVLAALYESAHGGKQVAL